MPIAPDERATVVVSTVRGAFGASAYHITSRLPPPESFVDGSSSCPSSLAAVAAR